MSKNDFMKALVNENNLTETENGAGALKSTLNYCLDAFSTLGTVRTNETDDFIISTFSKAYAENRETALRMLFYFRDIRGGQGARRVFRVCMKWLAEVDDTFVTRNLDNFLFFGRGDDLFCLLGTKAEAAMIEFVKTTLEEDFRKAQNFDSPSLLGKWLPSCNCSSKETVSKAKYLCAKLGYTPKQYRKTLSTIRKALNVVEQKMSAKEWKEIDYGKVPSRASMIYSNAFERHDEEGYNDYIEKMLTGESKVNAGALFPFDIVKKIDNAPYNVKKKDRILWTAMWNNLPDYSNDNETGICVVDTSGSMSGDPICVAISLGMYCADKCKGAFHNKFITFSSKPELQDVRGEDIVEKVHNLYDADWGGNTDLEAVFDLILDTAVKNNTPQEDLPSKLYIISDMQFDDARRDEVWVADSSYQWRGHWEKREPFMQTMKKKYAEAGYKLPGIVYWNVRNSDCGMFQQTFEGENCCMVSGYSPSLFKAILEGTTFEETVNEKGEKVITEKVDPIDVMNKAVYNERYDRVLI